MALPFAWTGAGLAALYLAARMAFGKRPAWLALALAVAMNPPVLSTTLVQAFHGTSWATGLMLGAVLVSLAGETPGRWRRRVIIVGAGTVAGINAASDPLLVIVALAPFVAAAAGVMVFGAGPAARRLGSGALAVVLVTIGAAIFTWALGQVVGIVVFSPTGALVASPSRWLPNFIAAGFSLIEVLGGRLATVTDALRWGLVPSIGLAALAVLVPAMVIWHQLRTAGEPVLFCPARLRHLLDQLARRPGPGHHHHGVRRRHHDVALRGLLVLRSCGPGRAGRGTLGARPEAGGPGGGRMHRLQRVHRGDLVPAAGARLRSSGPGRRAACPRPPARLRRLQQRRRGFLGERSRAGPSAGDGGRALPRGGRRGRLPLPLPGQQRLVRAAARPAHVPGRRPRGPKLRRAPARRIHRRSGVGLRGRPLANIYDRPLGAFQPGVVNKKKYPLPPFRPPPPPNAV